MRTVHLHTGALPIVVSMDVEEAAELVQRLDIAWIILQSENCKDSAKFIQALHDDILIALTTQQVQS